ncbi:hypothetical protein EVA_17734 [gut metagenome]|uniref:Uncharacterized protein n=1 Tax=gut metagenome TaxID=749906 RepID=J9G3Q3_9ZZZZ
MMMVPSRPSTSRLRFSSAFSGIKRKRGTLLGHFTRPNRVRPGSSS